MHRKRHEGWIIPTKEDVDARLEQLRHKGFEPDAREAYVSREIAVGCLEFHVDKQKLAVFINPNGV